MQGEPLVSILILVFNHEKFIEEAVTSALQQDLEGRVEVVIGEDCSADRTGELVDRLALRHPGVIRVIRPARNLGIIGNLGSTLDACAGKYIALLEGDDLWCHRDKLARQVEFLEGHPEYSISFHPVFWRVEGGASPGEIYPPRCRRSLGVRDFRGGLNPIQACSVMFRKCRFPRVPDWFDGLSRYDWPMFLLLTDRGPARFDPSPMAVHRLHPDAAWSSRPLAYRLRETIRFMERTRENIREGLKPLVDAAICNVVIGSLGATVRSGFPEATREILSDSISALITHNPGRALEAILRDAGREVDRGTRRPLRRAVAEEVFRLYSAMAGSVTRGRR